MGGEHFASASALSCNFLGDFEFGKLFAPISEKLFRAQYWERAPLILHRQEKNYYGDLFTLQDFDKAISTAPSHWTIAEPKRKKNTKHEVASTAGLESLLAEMRDGSTILLDGLQQREPKLAHLCRLLGQQLGYRFKTNLYMTPPSGQGFRPHWDNHDVFILQVVGSKHWQVEKKRRRIPGKNETMGEQEGRVVADDAYSFKLDQGDAIYIPRGFVHAAKCGAEPSLHITLGFHPHTWEDLLTAIVQMGIQDDERLQQGLPLAFMRDSSDHLVKGAMAALGRIVDQDYLVNAVERFKDELVSQFPLDLSGQMIEHFQPTPLHVEDIVGVRSGIVYRMHSSEDNVCLFFGARAIQFPRFFREPLDFALNNRPFAIRDIGGDLTDEEKIVFVERLLQEGLLVRR